MIHCNLVFREFLMAVIAYSFLDLPVPPGGASQAARLFLFAPNLFFSDNKGFKLHDIRMISSLPFSPKLGNLHLLLYTLTISNQ